MNIKTLAAVGLLPLVLAGRPFDDDDDDPIVEPEVLTTSVECFMHRPMPPL